jgi:hypothetical protein
MAVMMNSSTEVANQPAIQWRVRAMFSHTLKATSTSGTGLTVFICSSVRPTLRPICHSSVVWGCAILSS